MGLGRYEIIFIVAPNTPEEEIAPLITNFESVITEANGVLLRVEQWGRKKLAYEVKKFNEGFYVLFLADCEGTTTKELERRFRLTDRVIKFLTVRVDLELKKVGKLSLDEVGQPRETERIDKTRRSGAKPPQRTPADPDQTVVVGEVEAVAEETAGETDSDPSSATADETAVATNGTEADTGETPAVETDGLPEPVEAETDTTSSVEETESDETR